MLINCLFWKLECCELFDVYGIGVWWGVGEEVVVDDDVGSICGMVRILEEVVFFVFIEGDFGEVGR